MTRSTSWTGALAFQPVRLASFGVTTWTARAAGDRTINQHDGQDVGDEKAEHVARQLLVGDCAVAAADAEVGGSDHLAERRLAGIEERDVTPLLPVGQDQGDRRRRASDVSRAPPGGL